MESLNSLCDATRKLLITCTLSLMEVEAEGLVNLL